MYGAGVYCTYKLEDSIHNVKTKPEYGDCIVKMFLIVGFMMGMVAIYYGVWM